MPVPLPRDRTWRTRERSTSQTGLLDEVLAAAVRVKRAVVTFDLDSTLFDNRPRQIAILSEFASANGLSGIERLVPEQIDGWKVAEQIPRLAGCAGREAQLMVEFKAFWRTRFFTSDVCRHDVPLDGAAAFVAAVEKAGARAAYLTGRHEAMRAGTVASLAEGGFPAATLLMKPTFEMSDTQFKETAVTKLAEMGTVIAFFDNETTHVNRLRAAFPQAIAVWIQTDTSPDAEPVAPDARIIDGFLR
jgi:predicted secreted acid phosphatase